jgi:hypothetical protein
MTVTPQLGKIIRLLSSSIEGEVIAAVAAINRTLASQDLDIHDLAEVVDAGLQQKPAAKGKPSRAKPMCAGRPDGRFRMGDSVVCDQLVGPFRRCRCGSEHFIVMEGIGPHSAQLRCRSCWLGGRWLAKHYFG